MNTTTTILTGTIGVAGVTSTTLNDDGSVNRKKRNAFLATTTSLTASAIAGVTINKHTTAEVKEKYSQAYVKSMSDEELIEALQKFNLLDTETDKTLVK